MVIDRYKDIGFRIIGSNRTRGQVVSCHLKAAKFASHAIVKIANEGHDLSLPQSSGPYILVGH
ncbi:UNVERIFIED_ORG: hypothetical protein J2W19_001341 [Shinella zoogloeoides]|nr:hypothetical protein [Shinella zoogloeoides]